MANAGKAVAAAIPHATHRVVQGQTRNIAPKALARAAGMVHRRQSTTKAALLRARGPVL
jgi:hypothetical protein